MTQLVTRCKRAARDELLLRRTGCGAVQFPRAELCEGRPLALAFGGELFASRG
jgi:hypothetical protein